MGNDVVGMEQRGGVISSNWSCQVEVAFVDGMGRGRDGGGFGGPRHRSLCDSQRQETHGHVLVVIVQRFSGHLEEPEPGTDQTPSQKKRKSEPIERSGKVEQTAKEPKLKGKKVKGKKMG